MSKPRVYLAGPDLFFEDREVRYARLRAACAHAGLEAVAPTDGIEVHTEGPVPAAEQIYQHNMRLLRGCAAVLVNLSAFRGAEPDSGSVFDAAWAFAKGIPVVGYTVDGLTTADRHLLMRKTYIEADESLRDKMDGGLVEDFGQPSNLMLACSFPIRQTPQEAIGLLSVLLPDGSRCMAQRDVA